MIEVILGPQVVPVQIFNTTLGGVRALSDTATTVDIESRALKSANLSDLTNAATARTNIGAASISGAETLSNKTFSGATPFLLDGDRLVVTSSDTAPGSQPGVLRVQNENADNVGVLVNSYWEGSTGSNYDNNDTTLFVTYNKTLSDSSNRSWSASCSNNYNSIPAGVRDGGSRVGVLGWAGSVATAGYLHAGTLAEQYGVRGTAGFQGTGTPATAVVENAIGVEGLIISASAGTTIQNAVAGRFIVDLPTGNILDSTAIYAKAEGGSNNNYSFFGAAGLLENLDGIVSGAYVSAETYNVDGSLFVDKDGTYFRLWGPGANIVARISNAEVWISAPETRFSNPALSVDYAKIGSTGIQSNGNYQIGAVTLADKDGAFHRIWTAGGSVWAQGSNGLTFLRNTETRITSADAATSFASFVASGATIRMDTYADNAAAVAGGKAVGVMYKTATGEVRVVI